MSLYPGAALIATGLGLHGYRKGSLSLSGAITAWVVGYGHLANPLKVFGVTMIVMYLVASRATKVKIDVKATLEDGPDPLKPAGNRNWVQVLSNSLPGFVAALAYRFGPAAQLDSNTIVLALHPLARPLIYSALGLYSTVLADTLASELGILSSSQPIYLPTLHPVPPGTNGAVSLLGMGASALGGALMGLTMVFDLMVENPVARNGGLRWAAELVLVGTALGLTGSVLDSILGAFLQQTLFSIPDSKILTDHSKRTHTIHTPNSEIQKIGYGIDVLSNSGVNFVCGIVIAGLGWWYGSL